MNSLVGYGLSSESGSDGEDVNNGGLGSVDEVASVKKTKNFLLESGSASSDSGSQSEPEEQDPDPASSPSHSQTPAPPAACQPSLPPPSLGSLTPNKLPPPALNACSDSSVFANPFKAQADQKLSALQKHVPLTMQAKPSHIGGKRVCVSYRKDRRCRFGIKCKFAHDSDLQTSATPVSSHPPVIDESHAGSSCGGASQTVAEEEEPGEQQGKKRRVGLSDTLIPPKRAMKQYAMHRDRERINMS
ncbi:uncharacterized protein si:ch211-113e8.11 [Anabas testudineus]|uniref:uncharacterized protein si:ch211-113e8.11 n=1 Tax=Anabas testudineus TaxID=64144 RepID=UPI000E45CE09|nr:uncharacterized protein si:ch211-113e8.11 [Anabas testudineus]